MRRIPFVLAALVTGVFLLASAAAAQGYRLIPGDSVEVFHTGMGAAEVHRIDIDGQIRLRDVGAVELAGQTLDEAENRIRDIVESAGLYVDPVVTVLMDTYAPVVVAGDVVRPGKQDFLPGMTVATAIALAGGSRADGLSPLEMERARIDTEQGLRTLNSEIAETATRLTRLRTLLDEGDGLSVDTVRQAGIPRPGLVDLDALVANETRILDEELRQTDTLLSFWEEEIASLESQLSLLEQRIGVQNDILANAQAELENAQTLLADGLQTSTRVTAMREREADARSDVLAMESARLATIQGIAEARRERETFLANQRVTRLEDRQSVEQQLAKLHVDYERASEWLGVVNAGRGATLGGEYTRLQYQLVARHGPGPRATSADDTTELLPGDTLIVEVVFPEEVPE